MGKLDMSVAALLLRMIWTCLLPRSPSQPSPIIPLRQDNLLPLGFVYFFWFAFTHLRTGQADLKPEFDLVSYKELRRNRKGGWYNMDKRLSFGTVFSSLFTPYCLTPN